MVIIGLFSWWYATGWLTLIRKSGARIQAVLRFFSVPLLAGSLFAPFRQISAGRVQGSLSVQLQALGDRLFSRVIGAFVRSFLILIGLTTVVAIAIVAAAAIIIWPFLPLAPLVGLVLFGGSK